MNRRDFMGWSLAAAGMVFMPKFGRWHRQGSGLLVPPTPEGLYVILLTADGQDHHIPAKYTLTRKEHDMVVVDFADVSWQPARAVTVTHYGIGGRLGAIPISTQRNPIGSRDISLCSGDTLTIQWPTHGLRVF